MAPLWIACTPSSFSGSVGASGFSGSVQGIWLIAAALTSRRALSARPLPRLLRRPPLSVSAM